MKITGFTVERRTDSDKIRNMCINHGYYTRGDIKAYQNLLSLAQNNPCDDELIQLMAEDIYKHSDIEEFIKMYSCSEEELVNNILFNIYTEGSYIVVKDTTIKR